MSSTSYDWLGSFPSQSERFTLAAVVLAAGLLALAPLAILALRRAGKSDDKTHQELMQRWRSWLILAAGIFAPLLLGPLTTMAAVGLLSWFCYREYARATGLAPETWLNGAVAAGILLVTFAAFDNYSRLFFASAPLAVAAIAIVSILRDQPQGYLRRTAAAAFGFLLFGYSLGYLSLFANAPQYRAILILLFLGVELNDIFAYCVGKTVGGPKCMPHTSPGKTWAGCIGALALTTAFVAALGRFVFAGTPLDRLIHLVLFGAGLSVLGQLGDLLLSSIKRDVGIKDMSNLIPGHGGLLDRFDSLVLVPPFAFHYLSLVLGPIGLDQPQRV